jgi:long-chain acyl-CoA synthetase
VLVRIGEGDDATVEPLGRSADHEYYRELRRRGHAGLVLFSSGSTGASKAAVHDFVHLLEKFTVPRHRQRMMSFLQYDHIGGMNTLLYSLANAGCLVTVSSRDPDAVLEAIERHRVELLPTSPTFVNLILLSRAYERHDLRSLRTVTYGTEPMLESTLKRFHEVCPDVRLLQTYGLSEVGILRSKSKSSDSLWVKIGGEGFETRVVDGVLHIKARSAMLGYLNAASPFTDDGWFNTGDAVEVDGDYVRILGRLSELINVGGLKVYPTEVENVIQEMDNVAEVTVFGRRNPIVGNMVCARVRLRQDEDRRAFATRLKQHCAARLEKYKVPVKVIVDQERQYGERFKKQRSGNA